MAQLGVLPACPQQSHELLPLKEFPPLSALRDEEAGGRWQQSVSLDQSFFHKFISTHSSKFMAFK